MFEGQNVSRGSREISEERCIKAWQSRHVKGWSFLFVLSAMSFTVVFDHRLRVISTIYIGERFKCSAVTVHSSCLPGVDVTERHKIYPILEHVESSKNAILLEDQP